MKQKKDFNKNNGKFKIISEIEGETTDSKNHQELT